MVEQRTVLAGILGIVCAFAVLVFMGFSQSSLILGSSMNGLAVPSATTQTVTQSSTGTPYTYEQKLPTLGPSSSQSIESPYAISSAALLGVISLFVGLAAAFVISRRA